MKKTLILGLIVAGSSLMATEPFSLRSTLPKKEAKNNSAFFSKAASRKNFDGLANITLKMNLTQLALKNLSFMGEYGFHPKMSAGLGFSYLLERPLPAVAFPETEYFSTPTYKGRSITPEFRVYFGGDDDKPAPRGFYLAAYLRQSKYTMLQNVSYQETPTSKLYTAQGIHTIKGANAGLMIGYQWITESGFTIDWWITGGGWGKCSYSYEWTSPDASLTASEQADLKQEFTNYFTGISLLGSGEPVVTTTPKSAKATASGLPMTSVRFMGLCLGYSF